MTQIRHGSGPPVEIEDHKICDVSGQRNLLLTEELVCLPFPPFLMAGRTASFTPDMGCNLV